MRPYVVVDIETTGTQPLNSDIIEIGAVYIENDKVIDTFNMLVRPEQVISPYITSITGITNEMVVNERPIEEVMPEFISFCKDATLIGHNLIIFDYRMLKVKATRLGLEFERSALDTLVIARKMLCDLPSRKLKDLCEYYQISLVNAHRAYDDAYATYELFTRLKEDFYSIDPDLFVPSKVEWEIPKTYPITSKQISYLTKLRDKYNVILEKDMDTLTKSEASRVIDKIINQYGRL